MIENFVKSRYEFLRECWDTPTLVDIQALKNSPEWKSLSAKTQKMYNTMERYMLEPEPLDKDGEPLFDSVEVEPVHLHGTFG